ncbi:flavin reductase family protein [Catenovulum sediminis]|uniref:Flavin reductase family protein n=1 Tax=Catenovulum sediminis TaxID=1740262 RepID=A0ABV1RHV5_9ALTE|nr:flavin reductase family protein [Catenovulum sediminis]
MLIDMASLNSSEVYHLMTQTIVPRPVAWVLTQHQNAHYNLAPYSYFNAVSSEPPLLMYSAGKKPNGEIKDSIANFNYQQKCVVHIASAQQINQMQQSANSLPADESEIEHYNIELADFDGFELPRVKACPIAFGCELYQTTEIGDKPQTLVFVEIKQIYIADEVISLDDKQRLKTDVLKIDPIARLGGREYASLKEILVPKI